jgi:hypothetical protein
VAAAVRDQVDVYLFAEDAVDDPVRLIKPLAILANAEGGPLFGIGTAFRMSRKALDHPFNVSKLDRAQGAK